MENQTASHFLKQMCCQAKGLDEDTNPSHGNLGFVSPNPEFAEVSLK